MMLNTDICYQALLTHDARFDGAFYVGVASTRIYCRTVCTAKTPLIKNCKFFANAAAAEIAGYRPCLRCRPELAPGSAKVDAVNRAAAVIVSHIEDGALNDMSVAELAANLGMSERHLRRVLESSFGVAPLELAQTQRLLLAKRLLADTNLPITEVAFASGFASLRRFNALLKERYGLSPSQIRSAKSFASEDQSIVCQLVYRKPFDWHSILTFLAGRSANGVELIRDNCYHRTVSIGKERGWISVSNDEKNSSLKVELSLSLSRSIMPLLNRVRMLFDLNADPHLIVCHLGDIASAHPGLRVPGSFNRFETAIRAILGQQVSVKAASTLMSRFCLAFGDKLETPIEGLSIVFPSAKKIASLSLEEVISIGLTSARAKTLIAFAQAVASDAISLELAIDPEDRIRQLKELPGIGEWTAQYLAMRVLNWPDAFPAGDLGIRKALKIDNEKTVLAYAEKWRPWRAYAAMHLWKTLEI